MATVADRVRIHRARRRNGVAVLSVEVPVHDLADALVQKGWLAQWDAEDREAVEAALGRAVQAMITADDL